MLGAYTFLLFFCAWHPVASGTDFKSKDMSNLPCVDVDGDDNDQNCDNAFSRIHLGSDGENPVTKQAGGLSDFVLFNSVSDKQHPKVMLDEFKPGSFAVQLESRSSSPEAASPYNSSQLICALQDSQSNVIGVLPLLNFGTSPERFYQEMLIYAELFFRMSQLM